MQTIQAGQQASLQVHALTVVLHRLCRTAQHTLHAPEHRKSTASGHALHVQA
jgi:hypothetical protein